ncbi:MAG: pyridoxal-dependent decarboxylase [Balneolales bacterium]|nr:pyridoxal-dependent decarboxylase [Balneolales bacterium]
MKDMINNLDTSPEEFKELLDRTNELVLSRFQELDKRKAYHNIPQEERRQWFDEKLPEEGMNAFEILEETKTKVLDNATDNLGKHMYAYVMAGGTQISILGEQLAATINQNGGKWHLSPSIAEIEKRVVQWGADMIGYGSNVGGVLVSGGSAANLNGLTIARNIYFERKEIRKTGLFNTKPFTVYTSKEVHGCIDKSVDLLGIGTNHLRKIETNSDFTINLEALETKIKGDIANGFIPFCLVGNAGTVNTGAIDDLNALAELARKYSLWFHVDGAYGGLASTLDSVKNEYNGLDRADSVAIDFHKWLYQPFEVGCILVKNWDILKRAYFKKADYLDTKFEHQGRLDFNEHSFQLSRNSKALKVWMSIKGYGMKRLREMIQKDIDLTHYLSEQVEASSDFEIKARSHLAVSCFRYVGNFTSEKEIIRINELLIPALEKDGRVFITGTRLNGEFVLRACIINHRKQKEDIDYLLNVIREVAQTIEL